MNTETLVTPSPPSSSDPTSPPPLEPPLSEPENARPAAVTWIAATGTALLFAALAVFTIVQWHRLGDLGKFAVLIGATQVALTVAIRLRNRFPVTATALAHLGALLIPIDATALGRYFTLSWPMLLIVQGVSGLIAIVLLQQMMKSIVLDYARSLSAVATLSGIAAVTHASAPTFVAAAALGFAIVHRDRVATITTGLVAAFAPAAVIAIDSSMRSTHFHTGSGVVRQLGIVGGHWGWSLATAFISAAAFAVFARREQRLDVGALAVAAFAIHGALAWSALPFNSDLRLLALPAAFVLIELLSLSVRKDRLFATAASTLALAAETVAAIPTAVVGLSALLLVRIETPQGHATSAAAIAFGAVAWLIAATRSTDIARERPLTIGRIALAAAAAVATLSLLTNSHVQLATITIVVAIGALIAAHKHLAVAVTSLSTLTWAVAAAAGTRWGLVFACIATAAAIGVAIIDNVPNLSWFTIPSFGYLAVFGRHDAQIADRPLSHTIEIWALCTVGAIALAVAARVAQSWRSQVFTVAGIAATISLFDAVAHNRPQFGAALITISLGGLAHGLLTRKTGVAHAGGLGMVYGLWTITAMHKIGFIEVYMVPIAIQMLLGGYAIRRSAARGETVANASTTIETPQFNEALGYPTHSWAAYSPGLIALLVPSLWVGLQTGIQSHLLFSGIVAVLAVAVGGTRRLGAPLLLGTGALVVITGDIAMGPARTVPAWMWLALGGCTLIATAIGMERTATTPLAAGRRLVDVVHDQFA